MSVSVLPVLMPPCSLTPVRGRMLTFTSTPCHRSRCLPYLLASVMKLSAGRPKLAGLRSYRPDTVYPPPPGNRGSEGAVMPNVSKSDALTARLSVTQKFWYARRKYATSTVADKVKNGFQTYRLTLDNVEQTELVKESAFTKEQATGMKLASNARDEDGDSPAENSQFEVRLPQPRRRCGS